MIKQIATLKQTHSKAGIYAYRQISDGAIVYIGKDSSLETDSRHRNHLSSKSKDQMIDKIIKDRPQDFIYHRLLFCSEMDLDLIEYSLIRFVCPRYNIEYMSSITKDTKENIDRLKSIIDTNSIPVKDSQFLISILRSRS